MKVLAVIPSRYASTRLPGKPLSMIHGKPMIQWVWERTNASPLIHETVVATDDERIFKAVEQFGGKAVMTSGDHISGTDRIREAVEILQRNICRHRMARAKDRGADRSRGADRGNRGYPRNNGAAGHGQLIAC